MRFHRRSSAVLVTAAAVLTTVATGTSFTSPAAARTAGQPYAHFDRLVQDGAGLHVAGWAYDPSTKAPATVRITVDGRKAATLTANTDRPDVAKVHPDFGPAHGYLFDQAATLGKHTVCAYVLDYPSNKSLLIRCLAITLTHNPYGAIAHLTQAPGTLTATGWAADPDATTGAQTVAIRVDGKPVATQIASAPYQGIDIGPVSGPDHGFSLTFPVTEGTHTICLKSANTGLGRNTYVQCLVRPISFSPTGAITDVHEIVGGFSVTGYASDPDTTAPIGVTFTANGKTVASTLANRANSVRAGHGFTGRYILPGKQPRGDQTICAIAANAGQYGKTRTVQCVVHHFNWNPTAVAEKVSQKSPGALLTGWATDPDTTAPIRVQIRGDGKLLATVTANGARGDHPGHMFSALVPLPDGTHSVCAIALNVLYGAANSPSSCQTVKLRFEPYGHYDSVQRASGSTDLVATGWAIDPDTTKAIPVQVTVDGGRPVTATANVSRPDVAKRYPHTGTARGFAARVPATDGEHKVCVRAVNVLAGSGTVSLGCRVLDAVHPTAPSAPAGVSAIAGYGGARIVWTAPASDGGAPWTSYTVRASAGGPKLTVGPGVLAATLLGLKPSTTYTFSVVATNVAGVSPAATSPAATTEKEPPAQTSPAPISTSRYIRNIRGSSPSDLAAMRKEGAADAKANPSGHGFLVLLDIGGQVEASHGVILSAGVRYVSYANLVADLKAYVDGYAVKQRPSAPVTIALGTNNDIDVSRSSGASWANHVVDPVLSYAKRYPGITIAGANDIEPGFRASYSQTKSWLGGYLAATHAPFVFNGSADGCAWTATSRRCNNGWTMAGLFYLAGGASAIRIVDLPQIYNTTMAKQWRYISLTGVVAGKPKINFGGALTEWTACRQAGSCGSLTGNSAWTQMWTQLRADPRLRPRSLPYSTDLRIDS